MNPEFTERMCEGLGAAAVDVTAAIGMKEEGMRGVTHDFLTDSTDETQVTTH